LALTAAQSGAFRLDNVTASLADVKGPDAQTWIRNAGTKRPRPRQLALAFLLVESATTEADEFGEC